MNPDNFNFSQGGTSSIDYLNQISTPPPAEGFDKKTKIIIIILAIIGVVGLLFIAVMAQNTTSGPSSSSIAARMQKLLTVSQKYNSKLQSSTLQTTNSSLVAVLTSANSAIAGPLKDEGIDYQKTRKEIAKLDPSTELEAKLDDAALNAQLDTVYAHEINVQLTDTINMLKRASRSTKSTSMKEYLVKNIADLENIQKQLSDFLKSN